MKKDSLGGDSGAAPLPSTSQGDPISFETEACDKCGEDVLLVPTPKGDIRKVSSSKFMYLLPERTPHPVTGVTEQGHTIQGRASFYNHKGSIKCHRPHDRDCEWSAKQNRRKGAKS